MGEPTTRVDEEREWLLHQVADLAAETKRLRMHAYDRAAVGEVALHLQAAEDAVGAACRVLERLREARRG
jgi:hypothetical protein